MTFILNEHEWARDMIESRSIGKRPFETLCRVARYYIDEGYRKDEVRRLVETFLLQCKPDASSALWMDTLDRAVSCAAKRPAVVIDKLVVTKPELEAIDSLTGVQAQRLAFTLLCLAKYYDAINPKANHWVCADDKDIMAMASIKNPIRRQCELYRQLKDAGLIRFSKRVDNTNVCVLFVSKGEPAMEIKDLKNLGNQYLFAKGAPGYFRCTNCGAVSKSVKRSVEKRAIDKRGNTAKWCAECEKIRSHSGV